MGRVKQCQHCTWRWHLAVNIFRCPYCKTYLE